ncbi:transposable element Tcb2 transposase [Trichonephila clavipes]|nr:transposable element Tcb2 transposase [Trichonephila clavipes]
MNKILKTQAGLGCPIVLSGKFITVDDDVCIMAVPIIAGKGILEFVQSSKNIIEADSNDENEMNNAFPVPTSSEKRNVLKSSGVTPSLVKTRFTISIKLPRSMGESTWNRFLETGSAGRRLGQGRRWATTPNEDRNLVLTARRYRNINATLLQQHLRSATGTTVSTQTVRNRLHGVGRGRGIFIWRDRDSRNNPVFVHESVRFGGGGVLVYGGISIDGRTYLYIIRDGPLTARRYRDEILRPIVVPYAAAIGDDFILMDDNCRPHRANLVKDFLFEEGIVRME